jgi:hypothetical protein
VVTELGELVRRVGQTAPRVDDEAVEVVDGLHGRRLGPPEQLAERSSEGDHEVVDVAHEPLDERRGPALAAVVGERGS